MKFVTMGIFASALLAGAAAIAQQPVDSQCSAAATQATGYVPGTSVPPPAGGQRVRGAAAGAVVGGTAGDAGKGAAAGVVAGGVAKRSQRRRAARTTQAMSTAWQNSYNACMQQKGP